MIGRLLRPWRDAKTWRVLVHAVLDLPIGSALFAVSVALVATSGALVIVLPAAVVVAWIMFGLARLSSRVERSRFAALHGIVLEDPVPPLPAGNWWKRFKARLTTRARWKEIAYMVLRLPTGTVFAVGLGAVWSTALTLLLLPAYLTFLPEDTARFHLFGVVVHFGPEVVVAAVVGLAAFGLAAPWLTVLVGRLDAAFTAWLLGPPRARELEVRAEQAETGRAAAVDAAEAERRRIERDLHDGAQQRLVALAMDLGAARERLESDPEGGRQLVAEAHEEAKAALKEIRDLVRGIHPVILEDRGLDAALSAVVARSPIPVHLTVDVAVRPPAAVESAAYFVVSEALTNVARHARATTAHVAIARARDRLVVEVRDDGVGGADASRGTGLAGLTERVVGMGGTIDVLSPAGGPTTLLVELPCAS